jgi:hypothetical protein
MDEGESGSGRVRWEEDWGLGEEEKGMGEEGTLSAPSVEREGEEWRRCARRVGRGAVGVDGREGPASSDRN